MIEIQNSKHVHDFEEQTLQTGLVLVYWFLHKMQRNNN